MSESQNNDDTRTAASDVNAGNPCTLCNCKGFVENPAEPTECIGTYTIPLPGGRCQHSYLNHPPKDED